MGCRSFFNAATLLINSYILAVGCVHLFCERTEGRHTQERQNEKSSCLFDHHLKRVERCPLFFYSVAADTGQSEQAHAQQQQGSRVLDRYGAFAYHFRSKLSQRGNIYRQREKEDDQR